MKRSLIITALLLIGMASLLFASLPVHFALQIQGPEVRMVDEATNKADLTIKTTMLMAGDLTFHLRMPDTIRELPNNDQVITKISKRGLIESQEIEETFTVYLPDNGHFGFFVAYSFESTTDSEEENLVKHGIIPIYVTIRDGDIVPRNFLRPDTTYTRAPVVVKRFPEGESGIRETSGQTYNIKVRISGKIQYQPTFPPNTALGIPGVGVWLDWDYDNDPRTSYHPPGHSNDVPVTDMDGRYEFDFSFVSDRPAHHYSSKVRVYVNSVNDAAFDGDMGVGSQFPAYAYIDISNETSNINSNTANIGGIDPLRGSALRYLYRARRFSIDELGYTPHQIRYYFRLNLRNISLGWFCVPDTIIPGFSQWFPGCHGELITVPRIVFTGEPSSGLAYHEYGHFVEFDKVGVQVYDKIDDHHFTLQTTDDIAWTEGWAQFYEAACHMFWYTKELPNLPEPTSSRDWGPKSSRRVSYQFLDHSQAILPNTATTDRTKIEGAVACFLHSLWDDVTLRAPRYKGDNDDLSLPGSFLLERVRERWNVGGLLRASSHIESYKEALLGSLDSQKDASVIALYNSLVLRNGSAKPATCDLLSVSGNHGSRSLSWNDNTAPNRLDWNYAGKNYMKLDIEENNEQGFRIYRKQANSSWDGTLTGYTHIGTVGSNIITWADNTNLTGGTYSYVVTSYNASGNALPRAEASITLPVSVNRPPVLTGFAEAWVSEGLIRVTTYHASDPDKDSLVWSLAGADAAAFELFGSGRARALRLKTPPDFEQQATYTLTVGVSDGSRSATLDVTVWVINVEEAGRVALTSTQPQVGTPLTATLSDPDGSITGAVWQWQRRASATADWVDVSAGVAGTELSSYTPQAGDVGSMLQATVRYRDGHSNATKTVQSGATEAVVGPPAVVASLTAVPGDGQVVLGWQAPASDGGEPITGYEYRQSADGGTNWQPDWTAIANSDAETTGHTVDGLLNDTQYTFEVRAINNIGKGAVLQATATPVSSNRPPVLTGFAEAWVSEGLIRVTTYRASDPDKDSLVWSLAGADAAAFELFGSGQARALRLKTPPDFEQQATYTLTVGVSDGSRSATLDVTVRVINIEEAGRVALTSTQPQVGTPLTATLSDPDGSITGVAVAAAGG